MSTGFRGLCRTETYAPLGKLLASVGRQTQAVLFEVTYRPREDPSAWRLTGGIPSAGGKVVWTQADFLVSPALVRIGT